MQDDMWCGQSHFRILSLIEQECLTSANNNSTMADLPKKHSSKDNNVRFTGFNSKFIVTNNYWCSLLVFVLLEGSN